MIDDNKQQKLSESTEPTITKPMLAVRACEGSCEIHKGEVIPVIITGHGWDDTKFNYCQEAIEEDERRGFVVRHDL